MALVKYYHKSNTTGELEELNFGHFMVESKKELVYELSKHQIGNGNGYFKIDECDENSVINVNEVVAKFNYISYIYNLIFTVLLCILFFVGLNPVMAFILTLILCFLQYYNNIFHHKVINRFNKSRF